MALADIRITQGHIDEAMRTYEQALQLAPEHAGPVLRGNSRHVRGISEIHCERGDLHAAARHLLTSQKLGEHRPGKRPRLAW